MKKFEKGIIGAIIIMTAVFFIKIVYFQLNSDYPFQMTYEKTSQINKKPVQNKKKSVFFGKKSSKKNKTINLTVEKKKININSASLAQLLTIKGIGKKTAEKIIKYRNSVGKFKSKSELLKIKGIGKKRLNKIGSQINIK